MSINFAKKLLKKKYKVIIPDPVRLKNKHENCIAITIKHLLAFAFGDISREFITLEKYENLKRKTNIFSKILFLSFFFQAKQRASIKWLLAKAYNHKTPPELREPFYKDHDVRIVNNI